MTVDKPTSGVDWHVGPSAPDATLTEVVRVCDMAIDAYGEDAQERHCIEAMGALQMMLARLWHGGAESADVVDKAGDLVIAALQVGIIHGEHRGFLELLEQKARLFDCQIGVDTVGEVNPPIRE